LDSQGSAVSVRLEDLMQPNPKARIEHLATALGRTLGEIDLFVDLGAPNFEPYSAFAGALIAVLRRLGDLNDFRNFILISTAIPETFKDIAKGSEHIPRHDWMFYCELAKRLPSDMRCPNFGDYTIVHPEFTPVDMRKIKSSGKIVYTTADSWFVSKGGAFRDNPGQMHDHCAAVIRAGIFKGAAYSSGDEYIANCASKRANPSNQPWWKFVTINHHITHVLEDLAMLGAAP